jgi:hypothetical protein
MSDFDQRHGPNPNVFGPDGPNAAGAPAGGRHERIQMPAVPWMQPPMQPFQSPPSQGPQWPTMQMPAVNGQMPGMPMNPAQAFNPVGPQNPGPNDTQMMPAITPQDLAVMQDRASAAQQLASRFQVVPDDFAGQRNHNMVTAAEYQRICNTFSDIRMGRGDLAIGGGELDPATHGQYRDGAMENIAAIMQTTAGRNQIYNLHNNPLRDENGNLRDATGGLAAPGQEAHRRTTIQPLHVDANNDGDRTNDLGAPLDFTNAFADATNPAQRGQWYPDQSTGARGLGTDVNIHWNPGAQIAAHGVRSDTLLVHEMQHAMHQTQGTMATGNVQNPLIPADVGTPNYEHQAVGLGPWWSDGQGCTENLYRHQRSQLGDYMPYRGQYQNPGMGPAAAPPVASAQPPMVDPRLYRPNA